MLFLLPCLAALAAPADPEYPRLTGPLREAHRLAWDAPEELEIWRQARPGPTDEMGLSVVLESSDPEGLALDLEWMGAEIEAVTRIGVQAWVPYEDLGDVSKLEGATRVREPFIARAKDLPAREKGLFSSQPEDNVVSEGAAVISVDAWHHIGFEGKGVQVAILDVGFASYQDFLGSELPKQVSTEIADSTAAASPHGTAVAEIVHDMAPDAKLLLYQFRTDQEFLQAVDELMSRGVDVVNASIGFDNIWHADGTSPYSKAVNEIVEDGTVWVGAAGNENDKYAIGELADEDLDGLLEIDGLEGIAVYAYGGALRVSFRWSESMDSSDTDIDLVAFNPDGSECGRSFENQVGEGSSPYEQIDALCLGEVVLVYPFAAGTPDLTGLEGFLYGTDGIEESAWAYRRNLTLPGDADLGIAVGACYADVGETGEAPYYSSRGPTDDDRIKPDICGPTDVTTASYGAGAFMGTSAASPHVAGLATLVVEALGRDPDGVKEWMYANAIDLGEPGDDNIFGHGMAQAGPAPHVGCSCGLASLRSAWILFGLALWWPIRRYLRR